MTGGPRGAGIAECGDKTEDLARGTVVGVLTVTVDGPVDGSLLGVGAAGGLPGLASGGHQQGGGGEGQVRVVRTVQG
jgi:hypothetical protein